MIISNSYIRKLTWGIGFALFCALLALIYSALSKRNKKVFLATKNDKYEMFSFSEAVLFVIMTVFAGIRLNVGSDYYNYYIRFNSVSKDMPISIDTFFSIDGYTWLSFIIKNITDYEYAIFAVVAILLYWFLFHIIIGETEDHPAAFTCYLFMGFFANSLNIIKQCIAMMFVMCFYKYLKEKHYVRCLAFGYLAFIFHYSAIFAIVIIIAVMALDIKPSVNVLIIFMFFGVAFALILPQIIELLIRYIPSASGYSVYINWRRNNQIRLVLAVAGMSLIYSILLLIIVKNKDVINKVNRNRYAEIILLMVGLCINIASIRIWVVQRIALYFYQFIILVLPSMFQGMEPKKRLRTKQFVYLLMFVYLIFSGVLLGENEYYSYNTIFSGDVPIYDADYNRMFN